jgi:shikimate dehydrogenase
MSAAEECNRAAPADGPRRAAVLGSPISHSRSPQLHLAAYRALGLNDWTYDRIECTADELATLVGGLGPEWVGLSVTMPDKFAALAFADERTARAELVGSANTLLRTATGWRADNTDVDGVTGALRQERGDSVFRTGGQERGDSVFRTGGQERSDSGFRNGRAAVLGSGGTAPAALVGLVELGIGHVSVVARNPERAAPLLRLGNRLGVDARWVELGTPLAGVDVAVSTVPADAAAPYADTLAGVPLLLDAIYEPWPTPLAAAVEAAGGRAIGGLRMLLHQAFAQVEQFTGRPAPKEAMSAALDRH